TQLYQVAPAKTQWQQARPADPNAELTRLLSRSAAQTLATSVTPDPAALRDAALSDPGTHLLARLGPPPPAGRGRDAWAPAATAMDTYRSRYEITGPDALGPRPEPSEQARAWDHATVLTTALDHHLGLGLEPDQGLHL
ncbi:MAG: hypothetical protein ACRDWN_09405, partial [Acidimicrobiales bacterium]